MYTNAYVFRHYYNGDKRITIGCMQYLQVMTHAAYIYDIQHVVIDNLQFMIGSSVKLVNFQPPCKIKALIIK